MTSRSGRWRLDRVWAYAFLACAAAFAAFPLVLIVSTALKEPADARRDPFGLFSSVTLGNFADAWTQGRFGDYFVNTVVITGATVVGVVALSVTAGYGLARLDLPGRTLVFAVFIVGLMIPFYSIMIPLFFQLHDMGLLGSPLAVILPGIAGVQGFGLPLGVFLMRAFFLDLPIELGEAARIDGASEVQVFRSVMLPLAGPGVAVLAVLVFFQSWNSLLLPLLYLTGPDSRTLATGLYLFAGGRSTETALLAAASLIMIAPVLLFYLAFQREFIRGVTSGALKG
jgi:ABC-type glycerol-3-phosphate transport system permease component